MAFTSIFVGEKRDGQGADRGSGRRESWVRDTGKDLGVNDSADSFVWLSSHMGIRMMAEKRCAGLMDACRASEEA